MGEKVGYATEQLMELAGLAVSQSVYNEILTNKNWTNIKRVLTICGPGSNYLVLTKILNILN